MPRHPRESLTTLTRLGLGLLSAAALTSPWSGLRFVGLQSVDVLLVLSLVAFTAGGGLRLTVPAWVWAGAAAVAAVTVLQQFGDPATTALDVGRVSDASDLGAAAQWVVALLVLPALIVSASYARRTAVRSVAMWWAAGCTVSAAVALSDYVGVTSIGSALGYVGSSQSRQTGLTTQPNNVGVAAVLALPLLAFAFSVGKRRLMIAIAMAACIGGVYASGSRGALGALAVLVVLAIASAPAVRRRIALFAPSLLLAAAVGSWALETGRAAPLLTVFRLYGQQEQAFAAQSDATRSDLAVRALQDFSDQPFIGAGMRFIVEAHSVPLQLLSSGGLVLLIGFGIYIAGALNAAWRMRRTDAFGLAVALSLVSWMVLGLVANQLTDRYLYVTVGAAAALALHPRGEANSPLRRRVEEKGRSVLP